jgi:hypothetical protein
MTIDGGDVDTYPIKTVIDGSHGYVSVVTDGVSAVDTYPAYR